MIRVSKIFNNGNMLLTKIKLLPCDNEKMTGLGSYILKNSSASAKIDGYLPPASEWHKM